MSLLRRLSVIHPRSALQSCVPYSTGSLHTNSATLVTCPSTAPLCPSHNICSLFAFGGPVYLIYQARIPHLPGPRIPHLPGARPSHNICSLFAFGGPVYLIYQGPYTSSTRAPYTSSTRGPSLQLSTALRLLDPLLRLQRILNTALSLVSRAATAVARTNSAAPSALHTHGRCR